MVKSKSSNSTNIDANYMGSVFTNLPALSQEKKSLNKTSPSKQPKMKTNEDSKADKKQPDLVRRNVHRSQIATTQRTKLMFFSEKIGESHPTEENSTVMVQNDHTDSFHNRTTNTTSSKPQNPFKKKTLTSISDVHAANEILPESYGGHIFSKRESSKKPNLSSSSLSKHNFNADNKIVLPFVTNEHARRPFFYYKGQREDGLVDQIINGWSQHADSTERTPRQRAIKSLSIASTFKTKSWLSQVQIALMISFNQTRRSA